MANKHSRILILKGTGLSQFVEAEPAFAAIRAAHPGQPIDLLTTHEFGRLAKGAPADLLLFKPDLSWKIQPDSFESKSKNSPFEGLPVQGRVVRTVVDGRALFNAA